MLYDDGRMSEAEAMDLVKALRFSKLRKSDVDGIKLIYDRARARGYVAEAEIDFLTSAARRNSKALQATQFAMSRAVLTDHRADLSDSDYKKAASALTGRGRARSVKRRAVGLRKAHREALKDSMDFGF